MARLEHNPPAWAAEYVGRDMPEEGRCYELVRAVYAERLGIALPGYRGSTDEVLEEELGAGEGASPRWTTVLPAELEVCDVGLFRIAGGALHVGVVLTHTRMLHALMGTEVCLEEFTRPIWMPRLLGFYRYTGGVHLVARRHPFSNERLDVTLPAGSTLAELMAAAGVRIVPGLRAFVAGSEVPRELWTRLRPKPGRLVTVACVPEGGGGGSKDVLRVVLSIAVVAASIAIPGALQLVTASGALTTGGALLGAGIAIGGTLLINALIPPPRPRLTDNAGGTSTSFAIQGTRNELRPYQVIPQTLGRVRWAPPFAAAPYTEIVGDDQYVRCLYCLGYGPIRVEDLKIGETPLTQFEGVEWQIHYGYPNNRTLSLFPGIVTQQDLSVLLSQAASWQTRTTAAGVEEISVDVTFPSGLAEVDLDGGFSNRTVAIEVQYRAVGSGGPWSTINGDAGSTGSPTTERGLDFLARTPEVTFGGATNFTGRIAWSAPAHGFPDAKPGYLPTNGFTWVASSHFYAAATGTYRFAIDGSDACDLEVDGEIVASWYGEHAPEGGAGTTHQSGDLTLERGWHEIRVRVESRSAGGALAVRWNPLGAGWAYLPGSSLDQNAGSRENPHPGVWGVLWYTWNAYVSSITTTAAKGDQIRRNLSWAVPAGQYDVRLRRTTPDTANPRIVDQAYWTALRSIQNRDPVQLRGIARLALRIKATDQLNGVPDQFNCITETICRDWDNTAGAWVRRATNNPIALYRHILQGRANHRPIADARLDLATLQAESVVCDTEEFSFNAVIDFSGTVYERCADVLSAARATFGMRDGLYSVVRDKVQAVPVQMFTPRNSFGYRGRKAFHTLPQALRVIFQNADKGYERDERVVLDDGYTIDGKDAFGNASANPAAEIFEELQLLGCTDPELAFRHGRYFLAVARLRPEVHEISTDFEHLICSRGDLVYLTHDVPLLGLCAGRILGRNTNPAGDLLSIDVDEACPMGASGTYRVRVRLEDGSTWVKDVIRIEGEHRRLFFSPVVPAAQALARIGDLFVFGPSGLETRECLVKTIEIDKDLGARLELVDHAPGVHTAEDGVIPPFTSGVTRPPAFSDGPELPVVETIRSDDWVMVRDSSGVLQPRIVVKLKPQSGTRPLASYCQYRIRLKVGTTLGPWTQARTDPIDNRQVDIDNVRVGETYQIALRHLTSDGRTSAWQYTWVPTLGGPTVAIEHTVVGQILQPPDPVAFDVVRLSDGTRQYSWDLGVVPPDIAGVEIRFGPGGTGAWNDLVPLTTEVLQASPSELNIPEEGFWRFGLKSVDVAGNRSVNAILIDRTLGAPRLEGVAFSEDQHQAGWPGTKTDCFVSGPQRYLEAIDDATWATLAGTHGISQWSQFTRWNTDPRSPIRYEAPPLDAGIVFDFSPDCLWRTDGATVVEVAWSTDGMTYSAWTDVLEARLASVRARFLKARITVTATGGSPVPLIRSFIVLMRAQPVVHEIQDLNTAGLNPMLIQEAGDIRLPVPSGRFSLIRSVGLTFNGSGAGFSWELVDRDVIHGPRVRIYNAADVLTHAVIDATIRGL